MNTSKQPIIRANFIKNEIANIYCIPRTTTLAPNATVSALWSVNEIILHVSFDHTERICVRCGKAEYILYPSQKQSTTDIRLSVSDIETQIVDLNQKLSFSIECTYQNEIAIFDGILLLCDYQALYSNPCNKSQSFDIEQIAEAGNDNADMSDTDTGSEITPNGLYLFDRYSEKRNAGASNHALFAQNIQGLATVRKNFLLECDINIKSMPIFETSKVIPIGNYSCGLYFILSPSAPSPTFFFGIYRTEGGLCFFVNNGWSHTYIHTGKQLGERFHLSVSVTNHAIIAYADGKMLFRFTSQIHFVRSKFEENQLMIRMQRRFSAESHADDFEICIQNLNLIEDETTSILTETVSADLLGFPTEGSDGTPTLTDSLNLKASVYNGKYNINAPLNWKSSNEKILLHNGILSRPKHTGEYIDLSLMLTNGKETVTEKSFPFFVPATNPQGNVLCLKNDFDPYTGSAVFEDTAFVFNKRENSIVYDFGKTVTITHASLCGMNNEPIFVNKTLIGLYASEDNKTYRRINDFTLLNDANTVHFYNFAVQARYLKLHNVDATETAPIRGSLQKMFQASADTLFLRDGGKEFTQRAVLKLQNPTDNIVLDKIYSYFLSKLPIDVQKANQDLSDLRFLYNGKLLPHAIVDGKLYLRIYELPANANIEIQILYGNPSAASLENAPETFEMQYGTRSVSGIGSGPHWVNTVEKMPNGDLIQMTTDHCEQLLYKRSTDGGHTWSNWVEISNSAPIKPLSGGGFIVDEENNTVFLIGHGNMDREKHLLPQFVTKSHDSGYTWSEPVHLKNPYKWSLSYSNGIKLKHSKNGVDYVFSYCGFITDGALGTASSFYSKDGGHTWKASKSHVSYGDKEEQKKSLHREGGCSEDTIYEKNDGTLIMWNRYETAAFEPHFAVSRSYDSGITWGETHLGNVYTANTQPIITEYQGIPLLMWGGNNAMGATSHVRLPLSIAYSDDEAENFKGIQNLIFQSQYSELTNRHEITNPDIALYNYQGVDHAFIVAKEYRVLIEDFGNVIFKTKGAYDSFEHSTPYEEGWRPFAGTPDVTEREGKHCMHLGNGVGISRSFPEIRKGEISLTFYADQIGSGFALELQAAYTNLRHVAAPISLAFDQDGILYTAEKTPTTLKLQSGKNTLHLIFDGTQDNATLTLNDTSTKIPFDHSIAPYLCYINLWNQPDCNLDIERFIAIDTEDHTPKY